MNGCTILAILLSMYISGNTKTRAGTEHLKIEKPAADNLETQPMDVMKLSPPESLPATSSPEVPTEKLRQQYQQVARSAETPPRREEHETRFGFQ